jgi:hypothetical protein
MLGGLIIESLQRHLFLIDLDNQVTLLQNVGVVSLILVH